LFCKEVTLNRDNVVTVLDALRSGEHEQGKDVLHQFDGPKCCLGVIFHVLAVEAGTGEWERGSEGYVATYKGDTITNPNGREIHLPDNFCEEFGISSTGSYLVGANKCVAVTDGTGYDSLAQMNDGVVLFSNPPLPRKSFAEIADVIEAAAIRAGILEG
jgi:hypothetical protein